MRLTSLLLTLMAPTVLMAGPVNINTADAETLARELNGVGVSRAQAIIEYRERNGAFRQPEELLNVSGIGMQILEQNRENILLDD
ncbi:MAG: helix-hairpin-helix domain-containing protein [Chromatiales bacterium]|nr:helix-hairpin-helix domain-containing protein [Chromatiales bacterium]